MEWEKFSIGDLVEYVDELPFAKNYNSVGVVVEIVKFRDEWDKSDLHPGEPFAKGFMEELRMYHALSSIQKTPDFYPKYRRRMLEKMLDFDAEDEDQDEIYLIRVVWNTGDNYIEHPADLKVVIKINEKNT